MQTAFQQHSHSKRPPFKAHARGINTAYAACQQLSSIHNSPNRACAQHSHRYHTACGQISRS
eukprot:1029256-Lingulodinium_polyedra.AAC.1